MRYASWILFVGGWALLALGCASPNRGDEASIVPQPHKKVVRAGFIDRGASLPSERGGVRVEYTGAIMFVCANSPKHADQEVLIHVCPSCRERDYFYFEGDAGRFSCYACTRPFDNALVKCNECGQAPRRVRTKNAPRAGSY